jgi:DNA-binding NtrC family response regulator
MSDAKSASDTILFVDDEDMFREIACGVLEDAGYNVLAAAGAREAQTISRTYQAPIQLLITDVVMPGVSGPELAKGLLAERPSMSVLYLSGYGNENPEIRRLTQAGARYLQKPVTAPTLSRAIRELLDSSSNS